MADAEYAQATRRAKSLRNFYTNVITFAAVNIGLFVINIVTSPGSLWFYWVTIFWGIGLLFHALDVFTFRGRYLGKEWEKNKAKEIIEKDKQRKAG